jgi:phage-related protein
VRRDGKTELAKLYKILYGIHVKPVEFLGDSLDALRLFPRPARREAGFQLDKVQRGLDPDHWKPLKSVGAGAREIRARDESGSFRIIYYAQLAEAVYVLYCFQKKTPKTSGSDVKLARTRFKELMRQTR